MATTTITFRCPTCNCRSYNVINNGDPIPTAPTCNKHTPPVQMVQVTS